jgi:Mechanosensitive ion channel, conserved TM helix
MWKDVLADVISETLSGFRQELAVFGPRLAAMLVILVAGLVVAGALRVFLRAALRWLGFDRFSERAGLAHVLRTTGFGGQPSGALAAGAAFLVLAFFVLLAVGTLDLRFARDLVADAFRYLPQVLVAGVLLAFGGLVAGFARRGTLIAAVNAGLPSARLLSAFVQGAVLIFFAAMALEHLGVGRQIILVTFTILFGGVVLAGSLAFGLAGRDLARELLEKLARRGEPPREDPLRHL